MKRYAHTIISPIFVMAVFAIVFAVNGLFPFGDNSLSWCDMNQQVIPLLCDFKDILSGNEGLFLSMQNAGGMNFYGVFFFFLASPFSFLVAFVSKANIPFLMNILVVLKLSVCAVTAGIYFQRRLPQLAPALKVVLSVSYALCGYGMLFYQNIIWLDVMYLFPLLMLGIDILSSNGSPVVFTLSLTGIIIVNYYLSYMVILFAVLFFGIFACFYKKCDLTVFVKLGLCAVCALLGSAVVWLPSLIQYTSSGRTSNVIEGLKYSSFFAHTDTSLPVMLCTGIILGAVLCIIPRLTTQSRQIKLLITAFFITCIPIFIEPVNLMWHTGNYMSFPVRYGFIPVFLGLIICGEYLNVKSCEGGRTLFSCLGVILSISAGIFMLWYTQSNLNTLSKYVQTLWGDKASLQGLLILFICAAAVYFIVIAFNKKGKMGKNILALCLSILVFCEGLCSVSIYVGTAKDKLDTENFASFAQTQSLINDEGFYRVNMTSKIADANMTGAMGFNSLGHYTSLTHQDYMKAAKQLGLSGYWMEIGNYGGSILSDALLGVKYKISRYDKSYCVSPTLGALDLGIKSEIRLPESLPDGDRLFVLGEYFANMFGLENNPVTRYAPQSFNNCEYGSFGGRHNILTTENDSEIVYSLNIGDEQALYFDCYNGSSNALNEPINDTFAVYVNGERIASSYPAQSYNGLLSLGFFSNQTVTVELKVKKSVSCFSFGVFGVDTAAVKAVAESTGDTRFKIKGNTVTATLNDMDRGEMLLSLPYSKGFKITLDGKEISYYRCLTGFTGITVEDTGELKITFIPPGFKVGAILSVIGVLLCAVFFAFYKKLSLLPQWIKGSVYLLFISVFTLFILAVYVAPVLINLIL